MATIVRQGLQSCLESQVVESRTTLRLKLSSPKPLPLSPPQSLELALKSCPSESNNIQEINERIRQNQNQNQNPDNGGGWSFLQDLSNSSSSKKEENVYIHPQMKRYSSKLSEKSLELCTESLGCETGSDISSENALIFESSSSESEESEEEEEQEHVQQQEQVRDKPLQYLEAKKANCCRSFPPPLTTMSGAESLQFRPHREDGRLILMAVQAPVVRSCFQAERSDGRLRLSFVNDSAASNFDLDVDNEEDAENDVEVEVEKLEEGETAAEEEEEEEEEEEMEKGNCLGEEDSEIEERDTEGNNLNVGGEIGKEFQRQRIRRSSRRCKEGELVENKGLLNWEAFWVATS